MKIERRLRHPLFWVTLTLPLVLCATIPILPTYDDWSSTPGPNPSPFTWSLLLPMNSYWRPLENIYGYLIAHHRWLMPWLPHVLVITGHYIGCCYVYKLCRLLFPDNGMPAFVATTSFWLSVGAIATTTACDGMSQTWTHTIGIIALYGHLHSVRLHQNTHRWLLIVALATIVKENGIAWAVAIPVVGYGFALTDRKTAMRHALWGVLFAIAYTVVHFSIPTATDYSLYTGYFQFSMPRFFRGLALLLTFTWLPLDYAHLLHAPHRNLLLVLVSALLIAPFLWLTYGKRLYILFSRPALCILVAFFIVTGLHLITIFSLMHVYAGLGMAALLLGWFVSHVRPSRGYLIAFLLFVLDSAVIDLLHCHAAYQSGLLGRKLSQQAVGSVSHPVDRAILMVVDHGEPRYSNFYVIPAETFDNGNGILWETCYRWPHTIDMISVTDDSLRIQAVVDSVRHVSHYDCIWLLRDNSIETMMLP